jgi:hypothetical protein
MGNKNSNYGTRLSRPIVCSYDTSYEHSLEHYTAVRRMVEDAELGRVAVSGIYRDGNAVNHSVDALCEAGFRNSDISLLFSKSEGTKNIAGEKHTNPLEKGTTPGDTSSGEVSGSLVWLARIEPVATAAVGQFIAVGPIVAALATAGAGGTLDGFVGTLLGMGIPDCHAKRYDGRVKEGGILLSVYVDGSDLRAKHVLERTGADDISIADEESAHRDNRLPRAS